MRAARDAGQLGFDAILREADISNHDLKLQRQLAWVADTEEGRVQQVNELLDELDEAIRACDRYEAYRVEEKIDKVELVHNGWTNFASKCGGHEGEKEGGGWRLIKALASPQVSTTSLQWGRPGVMRLEAEVYGQPFAAWLDYEGVFGIGGPYGFQIRACRPGPFPSGTGYMSLLGNGWIELQEDEDFAGFAVRAIEHQLITDSLTCKPKKKPRPLAEPSRIYEDLEDGAYAWFRQIRGDG
jgi:hypothetical protein